MLWLSFGGSNIHQKTQIIFSLPKRQKRVFYLSCSPWWIQTRATSKATCSPWDLSPSFLHTSEDGEVSQKWWAVASQAKELITAWWGFLGASPTCAGRALVSKSSFCWLHRKEQRLLSVQVLVCYPGNQSRCAPWRSVPSCIGSGLTHQAPGSTALSHFTTAEVSRSRKILIGLFRHSAPNLWLDRY